MDNHRHFDDTADSPGSEARLAGWLRQILQSSPSFPLPSATSKTPASGGNDTQLELLLGNDYHLHFYQQLPDFIAALLHNDPLASLHYAPLLFHLAGCSQCHNAYLELYDSMRFAIQPQTSRTTLGQGTRTLSATPQRMLGHLCQVLISQAGAILRQARHDHVDRDAPARSLLQLALRINAHIIQSSIRRHALRDLVAVATLFDGPSAPRTDDAGVYAYTPTLTGTGGAHGSRRIMRRADTMSRPIEQEVPTIHLRSRALEGTIVQRDDVLELHLRDLAETMRGRYAVISVLLGSLIEPVRWLGGNPRAIRSTVPVDEAGILITPLGQTELQLNDPEEHNLLEAMFMLLEVRAAD